MRVESPAVENLCPTISLSCVHIFYTYISIEANTGCDVGNLDSQQVLLPQVEIVVQSPSKPTSDIAPSLIVSSSPRPDPTPNQTRALPPPATSRLRRVCAKMACCPAVMVPTLAINSTTQADFPASISTNSYCSAWRRIHPRPQALTLESSNHRST